MLKIVISLVFISIFTRVFGMEKHCILFSNTCVSHCPRNMHPYHTRCDVDTMSQRTCEEPFVYSIGYTCGWSRCDCNGDLLLDEKTETCVDYHTCTNTYKGKKNRGRRRKTSRVNLPKNDDEFPVS